MGERKRPANCGNKAYTLFDSLRLCHSTTCLWPDYAVRHANMALVSFLTQPAGRPPTPPTATAQVLMQLAKI